MKKFFAMVVVLALLITTAFSMGITAYSAEVDETPDFTDDFENYTTDVLIEDNTLFSEKWDNEKIRFNSGDETAADDTECANKAKVIEDPTTAGNKVLFIDTETANSSFFYVGFKDIRVKEFELSYKMYSFGKNNSWFGILARKASNVRFNGTTNMMFTYLVSGANESGAKVDAFTNVTYRNYGGSSAPNDISDQYTGTRTAYGEGEDYLFYKQWITVKLTARLNEDKKTVYTTTVTDKNGKNYDLGSLTYGAKSVDAYGYISFASCVAKTYIDDVHMTNLDTEPAPKLDPPAPVDPDTNVTNIVFDKTELTLKVGDTDEIKATIYPDTASDKTLTWTSSDEKVATVSTSGVVTAVKEGTAIITATATKGGATRKCEVTVTGGSTSSGKKNSCGMVSTGTVGIVAFITALGLVVINKRK